jgi:hypothetical protein
MASLKDIIPGGFDANAVAPAENRSGEPLPAGLYDVEITGSEIKETSKKNGMGLKLEYTVISPAGFARRKVFGFINLVHENEQAQSIGQAQLSALCRAVNLPRLDDSDQLFQKIVRIRVKIRPAEGKYEASNDVTGFEPAGAGPLPTTSAAPAAAPAAGLKPWQKRAA